VSWYCYTAFRGVYRCDLVNWLGGKRALSGRENETLAEERWSSAFGSGEATFYEERRAGGGEFADQIGWTGAAWEVRWEVFLFRASLVVVFLSCRLICFSMFT